jgi:hypothetical protein
MNHRRAIVLNMIIPFFRSCWMSTTTKSVSNRGFCGVSGSEECVCERRGRPF